MAEPTRICVAPIAIALSKSLLIPIDNPSRPFLCQQFFSVTQNAVKASSLYWWYDHQAFNW